jgi:signal transduction histidine kinase
VRHAGDVTEPSLPLAAPVEALDLFAGLLSEADAGPSDQFHSRMAAATCRLAAMRRAVIFAYDDERRLVRAVGAHGIDLALFEGASPTAEQVALARTALAEDRVVEVTDDVEAELPEEFHDLLMQGSLTCTPMSAGGRWFGVIIADRAPEQGPLTGPQRHTLWLLGKVAALAAGARNATREHELARQLADRIDFARDLHEAVVQRLFGVSLALSGEGDLSAGTRERCLEEIQSALGELRAALQRPLARRARPTATTVAEEVARLRRAHRDLSVSLVEGEDVEVPERIEPLAQSVLREAVRNAGKHAEPTAIDVRLAASDGALVLEVINDGVPTVRPTHAAGMGLRLAAFEALEQGGVVEFGPADGGHWRVRLTVPLELEGA